MTTPIKDVTPIAAQPSTQPKNTHAQNTQAQNTQPENKQTENTPSARTSVSSQTAQLQKTMPSNLLSEITDNSETIFFGMNFKYTEVKKKGLINSIKGNTQPMDLDLSCVLYDSKLHLIDTIWFKQLRDSSEAIRHHGDSLNGKDRGSVAELDRYADVETIELRLSRLPITVAHVALFISSYHGYPIRSVERGNLYLRDDEGNELYGKDLTTLPAKTTAKLVATLSRELKEWRLTIHNIALDSAKMEAMALQAQKELSRLFPMMLSYR